MDADRIIEGLRAEAALSSTYGRGLQLAKGGAVGKFELVAGSLGSTVSLTGRVEGSHGERYRTDVQLDADSGEMLDFSCTCPAAENYDGMCKHEIALVLDYLARNGAGPAYAARLGRKAPAPTPRRARQVPTSPQIVRLLNERSTRLVSETRRARSEFGRAPRGATAPVELLPTILPARDSIYSSSEQTWCIKLRVRSGSATYVVMNISALVDAWRSGSTVTYGKNLSFAHTPEAFTERARELLKLVLRVAASQRALFLSRWKYQEAGSGTEIKELPMAAADLIEMLDLLDGATVAFEPNDGPYGSRGASRTLRVQPGDPMIHTRLELASDGGCSLKAPKSVFPFAVGDRMYLLDEEHAWRCSPEYAERAGAFLTQILPCQIELHVAQHDLPAFCRDILPALRAATDLEAPAELDALVPPEPIFTFKVGLDDGRITCDATVAYGAWEASLYGEAQRQAAHIRRVPPASTVRAVEPVRDRAAEYRVMDAVEAIFPGGIIEAGDLPGFDEDDDELLYNLLTEGLHELDELGEVLLSERLRSIRVQDSPNLTVRATLTSGLLDVAVNTSGLSAPDLVAYLASYKRKQKFVRLKNGDIMRLGEGVAAVGELADGLGVDATDLAAGVSDLPVNRALFVDGLLRHAPGLRLSRNDEFRALIRDFDTFADADFEVPASLSGVLRPYQQDGFRWLEMLERFGFGGILADDMGLGKTLQVIAHILARKEAGEKADIPADKADSAATLVVCPASLVYNWTSELERFAPALDVVAVLGSKAARRKLIAAARDHDVLVTSYDLMRRDVDLYEQEAFARVILDEAQYIKNPATQVARAAKRLPSRVRFALTGTPIENRTAELWSIFDFLMPGALGSRDTFSKAYGGPVEGGDERATERLRCLVAPFILRRLKTDVLRDLPQKTENVLVARMAGEQLKLYQANQDRLARQISHELPAEFGRKKLQVLSELTRLRQICCDPSLAYEDYAGGSAKLDMCLELVSSAIDGGHRVLLFSQFTSMLDIIATRLAQAKVPCFVLTGSTSKEERRRLVARFQAGEAPVFLISLRAGGVGLNLTAADVVIHCDPWWNLAAQNQATDRAYRIGQERNVSVYKLICADTIEERIVAMQESKRELAEGLLSGEGVRSTSLSRDDILTLLNG